MASSILGLGRSMHNAMINGMQLGNQIADYQNANLVDQYKYPAYIAEANAARTGAEAQTYANLGAGIGLRRLANQEAESDRLFRQTNAGATEEQGLLNIGQAPAVSTVEAIMAANPNTVQDFSELYRRLYGGTGSAGQALEDTLNTYVPQYLR